MILGEAMRITTRAKKETDPKPKLIIRRQNSMAIMKRDNNLQEGIITTIMEKTHLVISMILDLEIPNQISNNSNSPPDTTITMDTLRIPTDLSQ